MRLIYADVRNPPDDVMMMMMTTYKVEAFAKEGVDFEIIVIDDGSPDGTGMFAERSVLDT